MKLFKNYVIILSLLIGCVPADSPSISGVTVSFKVKSNLDARINEDERPSSILITIMSKTNNELIYNLKKLPLYELGEGYITEKLELFVGQYEVLEFAVLNEEEEVIFLTPKEGSEFASLVETPLPKSFIVNASEVSEVTLEVIRADLGEPADYGYAVFNFDVINTLEKGLIAHYKFDNNLKDSGPYQIDLSPVEGNPQIMYSRDRNGNENSSITFDGTFGVIAYGNSYLEGLYSQSDPQTMSFWMKTDDPNANTEFGGAMVRVKTTGASRFYTSLKNGQLQFNYGETHLPPYGDLFLLGDNISDGYWKHIVFISQGDGENGIVYINGIKVNDDLPFTINNESSNPDINIGGDIEDNLYIGTLDDIRLYNRALTEVEVLELFDEEKKSPITLQPNGSEGKDAVMSHYYSNKNYGDDEDIHLYAGTISGTPNHNRVLIEFDLTKIPENATLDSAFLSLYFNYNSVYSTEHNGPSGYNGSTDFIIYKVTSDWEENTVNYENQPSIDEYANILVPGAITGTQDFENIDVTSIFQTMFYNRESNFGFLLKLVDEDPYRMLLIASSDHPDEKVRPKLDVYYTIE